MLLEKRTELGSYKAGSTRRTGQTVSRQAIEMMKYPRIKDESESCCRMSNWGAHSGLWGGGGTVETDGIGSAGRSPR